MASQRHPTGNDNDHDHEQLDDAEEVLEVDTPFQGQRVYEESGSNTRQANTSLIPSGEFNIGRVEDVLAEHHAVASGPAQ